MRSPVLSSDTLPAKSAVDVKPAAGSPLSAVSTGHVRSIRGPREGVEVRQRDVRALIEVRAPFELSREAIDNVERGAKDSDWQPAKDAARQIAFAEDGAVFEGYPDANIVGIRQGTSNPKMPLRSDVLQYPDAIAQGLSQLRMVGVNARTRSCWVPRPIPLFLRPAITDIQYWSTSNGW